MRIKFITADVIPQPAKGKGKPYNKLEVTYKNERDETKSWNIMSFSNPQVFDALKDANKGDFYDITVTKNGEYNNWTSATKVDPDAPPSAAPSGASSAPTKVVGSTYETKEERAVKQRLIVRQSSLSNAIEFYKAQAPTEINDDDVSELADRFAAWVYAEPSLIDTPDDIPF